ncbi:hypothetical protein [Vibrio cincinnatiensis]|uniref:hypothetical protein n=1 Tax=Vibrio cincinnatiensis TaxID=675 RepID=UPI001EDF1F72|nr:hypothetical protein [Vibrio cincinnatiensis]
MLKGSETTPDVAVAIRARIVEVQRHGASIAAIVPVGARNRGASDVKAFGLKLI